MALTLNPIELVTAAEQSGSAGLLARHRTWERVPLEEVADVLNGFPFKSHEFNHENDGMPLIRIRDVGRNATQTYYSGKYDSRYLVHPGDMIVGMDGDFRVAIWNGPRALLNQRVCKISIRDPKAYNFRFLLYVLQGYLDAIGAATSSVTVKHLSSRSLQQIPLPLPPLSEQSRIVEALDDHISRLDAASSSLDHAQSLIPLQRRALCSAATEGRIAEVEGEVADFSALRRQLWTAIHGEKKYKEPVPADPDHVPVAPKGWKVFSLEALTDPVRVIRYGILMPKVKTGGTVPYVEVKDLRGCSLHDKRLHLTSAELDAQFAGARIESGDVVLAVRGSYDRSAVVPKSLSGANVSRDVARIAPLPGVDPEYLHIYLQSNFSQRYLATHARGVAVKGVNIASIRALPVAIPSLATQMKIVEACQQQFSVIDAAENAATLSSSRCAALRKAILIRAFSGELVHQDLAEEPAIVLRNRIRAAREAQGGKLRRAARRSHNTVTADAPPPPSASSTPYSAAAQQELPL